MKEEWRGWILCLCQGDCLHAFPRLFPALFPMIREFCRFCFQGVTQHLFIFAHRPSLRSTDSSCLYFSSCKQPFVGSIFTFLLAELPDHKELISQQTHWTGTQWMDSWGKPVLNRGKAKRENSLQRETIAGGPPAGVPTDMMLKRPRN